MNKKNKEIIAIFASALVLIIFNRLPNSEALSHEALCAIGIFIVSLILWIFVSIDWPSLITIFLVALLPTYGFSKTLQSAFGNSTVAFLLFSFMLVYPLSKTNFVRRTTIAFITNKIAIKGPWYFVSFLLFAVTFIGLFISPSVLFVAFMPFFEDICNVLDIKKGTKTGSMLMLGVAFCISLSSGMTPIGHVWPTIAIGAYYDAFGKMINSFEYMAFAIPTGIILVILLLLVFRFIYNPKDINLIDQKKVLVFKKEDNKMELSEKIILAIMVIVVLLWITPSLLHNIWPAYYDAMDTMTTAMPPLLGCILLFIIKVDDKRLLDFKEVTTKGIMWGAILMTGAATLIGGLLTNTTLGISAYISSFLSPIASVLNPGLLVLFFVAVTIIETNFSSNIVTTTLITSIIIAVSGALTKGSVNVGALVAIIGLCAAICNMTPAGQSTINTVAIGSGYTTSKDMFIYGLIFAVLAIICIAFIGYPIAALLI